MPSWMVINTDSAVGYNNQLKQAEAGMKLGINNEVNTSTKCGCNKYEQGGEHQKLTDQTNKSPSNLIYQKQNVGYFFAQRPATDLRFFENGGNRCANGNHNGGNSAIFF